MEKLKKSDKKFSYNNSNQKRKHRITVERYLDRKLRSDEIVHHKNGNIFDNRLCNLQVMSLSEHIKLHQKMHPYGIRFKRIYFFSSIEKEDMKNLFKTKTLKFIANKYRTSIGTIQNIVGKKQTVYCKRCGNIANYRSVELCSKCYHHDYFQKRKNRNND